MLSFSKKTKLFIIELYSPGDGKALIQHVPMTEAELLIFPELFLAPLQMRLIEEDFPLLLLHNLFPIV